MAARKLLSVVRDWLGGRNFPVVLAVLAFLTMLPCIKHGWYLDDLMFRARLLGLSRTNEQFNQTDLFGPDAEKLSSTAWELYAFVGRGDNIERLREYGYMPWWIYRGCKVSFWRPVASFSLWLDYRLFPNSAELQHVHSVMWFAAAVFVLTIFYRRLMGPVWAAALAGLLYMLGPSQYFPVAFIANRNSVIALFFGILCLLMHDRWRREGWVAGAILSGMFLALSLLSAEAGVATVGYLAAYAMALDGGRWPRRLLSLAPCVILTGLWRVVYSALGYATYGSGIYIDPGREPLRFAAAAIERAPMILFGQLSSVAPDIYYMFNDSGRAKILMCAAGFLGLLLIVLLPLLWRDRVARFWLLGTVFSVVPICATMASSRNMLFLGIGAMGLVAHFAGVILGRENWLPKWRLWRGAAWVFCATLLLVHVVGAAAGRAFMPKLISGLVSRFERIYRIELPEGSENQDIVVVNAPCPLFLMVLPADNALEGQPVPRSIRNLAPAFVGLEMARVDERSILLRARRGSLFFCEQREDIIMHPVYYLQEFNTIFRDVRHPLRVGDKAELRRMTAEVRRVGDDGMPTEVLFRFAVSLDDESLRWVRWDWKQGRFLPFAVPAVAEESYLEGPFE